MSQRCVAILLGLFGAVDVSGALQRPTLPPFRRSWLPARNQYDVRCMRLPSRWPALVARIEPSVAVGVAGDPLSVLAAAQFLASEVGDELPLRSGVARTMLFLASLTSPGALPNPFATTRWEPVVYAAKDDDGRVVGVIQTALANVAPMRGELRTVRFFQNVVVAKAWRRQGVASKLLDFAEEADRRFPSALAVEPQNEVAVQMYLQRGFAMAEDEPERDGVRLMLR